MRRRRILLGILAGVLCVSTLAAAGIAKSVLAASSPTVVVIGYPELGNQLTVAGSGFPANHVVTITYDSTTTLGTAFVHQLGIRGVGNTSFTTTVTMPEVTAVGVHTISATDPVTDITASTTITLNEDWPMFGFSPAGTRYNPYDTAISPANISQLKLAWSLSSNLIYSADPQNSLSLVNGSMFMGGGDGELTSWSTATQQQLWMENIEMYNQPAIANGVVYAGDNGLTALNAATGSILWEEHDVYPIDSSPTVAGGFVYVQGGNGLYAYRANGCGIASVCTATWGYVPSERFDGVPAVANGSVYEGSENGSLYVLNASTGAVQWTGTTVSGRIVGGAVVDGSYVIVQVGNSTASAQDSELFVFPAAGCGEATCAPLWSAVDGAATGDAPAAANGVIYIGSQADAVYAYNEAGCGSSTCSPVWAGTANYGVNTSLAVANGVVYGVDYNQLLAYNAAGCGSGVTTCAPIWTDTISGFAVLSYDSPVVDDGYVFFITSNSTDVIMAFTVPASSQKGRPSRRTHAEQP